MTATPAWDAHSRPWGAEVIPHDDLVGHESGRGCPCGPTVRVVTGRGLRCLLVRHHALDGRT